MISATVTTSSQNTTFIFLLNVLFELDLFNLAAFFPMYTNANAAIWVAELLVYYQPD